MQINRHLLTAAGLLLFLSGSAHAAVAIIEKDANWSADQKESDHEFKCPTDKVLVGRSHDGDENGTTKYLCATVKQNGPLKTFNEESITFEHDESGLCPSNKLLTGRGRKGDENSDYWIYCSEVRDVWGEDSLVRHLSEVLHEKESDHKLECSESGVLYAMHHSRDENGPTYYFCAKLF